MTSSSVVAELGRILLTSKPVATQFGTVVAEFPSLRAVGRSRVERIQLPQESAQDYFLIGT